MRLAGRLLAWGALERDDEGQYSIGLRLLEVASLAPRGHGLRQVALPFMSDLAAVTQQHVQLAVREGLEVTLVERFSSHSSVPVLYRVGGKMPLHCTGMGLALLAFAPVDVQEDVLSPVAARRAGPEPDPARGAPPDARRGAPRAAGHLPPPGGGARWWPWRRRSSASTRWRSPRSASCSPSG